MLNNPPPISGIGGFTTKTEDPRYNAYYGLGQVYDVLGAVKSKFNSVHPENYHPIDDIQASVNSSGTLAIFSYKFPRYERVNNLFTRSSEIEIVDLTKTRPATV